MINPRRTETAERVLLGSIPPVLTNQWRWQFDWPSLVRRQLAALANAGLLVEPGAETLGWEVLTRQPDGTWLANWDALTHPTREAAEREAERAASQGLGDEHRVSWPSRVARLVADGPVHEVAS